MSKDNSQKSVQTTGHSWDGDLQEFNNPLPRWWLWAFYATIVFAVVYWFLYPTLPIGRDYTKGIGNEITYTTADGKTVTTHWNTRALFLKEKEEARKQQAQYLEKLSKVSYEEIAKDPELSAFALSRAKVLFADNCAACHQRGGDGVLGEFPNLLDDSWLWGGTYADIEQTITNGRHGMMPAWKGKLSEQEIEDVVDYVLSLSGEKVDAEKAARGKTVFMNNCAACHGQDGKGQKFLGSANLTDQIWTIAKVPQANSLDGKRNAVREVVENGKTRTMPAWKGRLSDTEIKILTFYVHELGGGQ